MEIEEGVKMEVKGDNTGAYNVADKCIVHFNSLFNSLP